MSTSLQMLQQTPDWGSLRSADPEWASVQLTKILSSLEGSEKTLFAVRGMCALLIEERELYRFVIDQEVGDYYVSFDRWLKQTCPNSWSYCRDALRAVKELKDMPFTDLLEIKRANLEQLKKVSSGVRLLPEVVRAAKDMPEKQFVEKMNREHSQHLAVKQPVVMAEPDACEDFEEAIEMAIVCEHCVSRAEAIRAISISYKQDWAVEYERRKAEGAA
jgi:hypothetical protein